MYVLLCGKFETKKITRFPDSIRSIIRKIGGENPYVLEDGFDIYVLAPSGFLVRKRYLYNESTRLFDVVEEKSWDGYRITAVKQVEIVSAERYGDVVNIKKANGNAKPITPIDAIAVGAAQLIEITDKDLVLDVWGREEVFNKAKTYITHYLWFGTFANELECTSKELREDYKKFFDEISKTAHPLKVLFHNAVYEVSRKYDVSVGDVEKLFIELIRN